MYQVPKVNPTKAQVQAALDKAKWGLANYDPNYNQDWKDAYNTLFQIYQGIIDLMNVKEQLLKASGLTVSGIGYTYGGVSIFDKDVLLMVPDPPGPATMLNNDFTAIVNQINHDIANIKSGTGTYVDQSGNIQVVQKKSNLLLILLAGGAGLYFAYKT